MYIPVVTYRETEFPISKDPYAGNLRIIANEPNKRKVLSNSLPHDILILHESPKPITEERFRELINHFDGIVNPKIPLSAFVQIGKDNRDRVEIQLGKVPSETPAGSSQALLASFSADISPEIRSSVTGSIYRSMKLLSMPVENFNIFPHQRLPKHKLLRALRSTGWTMRNNYFPAYTEAILNQRDYRVVAYIPNNDNVEQIRMTFPGAADGEHSRFHAVKMQDLIRGIYSASAKDEERQPLLTAQA